MMWTKQDVTVFTESAGVEVGYILLRLSTPSRHLHAIGSLGEIPGLPRAFRFVRLERNSSPSHKCQFLRPDEIYVGMPMRFRVVRKGFLPRDY